MLRDVRDAWDTSKWVVEIDKLSEHDRSRRLSRLFSVCTEESVVDLDTLREEFRFEKGGRSVGEMEC